MSTQRAGGCACGAVRYEISGDVAMSLQCHCKACQKDTGTGHSSILVFPKAAVTFTGPMTEFTRPGDSGGTVTKAFCPTCGTTLRETLTVMPDVVVIHVGSLDDPSGYTPQVVVYASRAHDWDRVDPALPKFPKMPPM
jgi:hypothetical protein